MRWLVLAAFLSTVPLAAEHVVVHPLPLRTSPHDALFTADGTLWIASSGGLYRLDPGGELTRVHPDYLKSLILGADGAIWSEEPFSESVVRIDPDDSTLAVIRSFPGENIYTMEAGLDGTLWIVLVDTGFDNYRLVRLSMGGEIVSSIPVPAAAYGEYSHVRTMTSHGLWWIETVHNHLMLLTPTGNVQQFSLPFSNAQWIRSTDAFLWVVSSGGEVARIAFDGTVIARYHPVNEIRGAITDAAGDLWLRERHGLSRLTRDGVYARQITLAEQCPDAAGWSAMAVSPDGRIAAVRSFLREPVGIPIPQPCVDDSPPARELVFIVDPVHLGDPHDVPAAGTVALMAIAVLLALAGAAALR